MGHGLELPISPCPLHELSEECAIQLHHYTPQDEIDKGMFYLFANKKSNPKELFEALQEIIKNRENNLNNNKNNSNDESADEVYELLSQEVSRLQELYFKGAVLPMDVGKKNDQIRKKRNPTHVLSKFILTIGRIK
ncbi:hypothetical protein Glove_151g56 [Diversispora epigaea]|uniref:Uncharacterized protein n=1 Tax=Diversispora epigaea TaxID=1348612 RepID=A0A397J226_9GLOM|nr:hypothetical protein Glove_151g56 [Diversispora epigaea]